MVKVVKTIRAMKELSVVLKQKGHSVGLVPTMGSLHEGHLSLVRKAKKDCGRVVVSIFVNPAQFGPKEDLQKYPRDFARDVSLLSAEGVDAVFYPKADEMYPQGYRTYINVDDLSDIMCGRSRPGHFRGVATVVAKLFNIIKPDKAYFGEKDFQQLVTIKRMVNDLNMDVKVVALPTVRENDGLAMSSRNAYLNREERSKALVISRALKLAKLLARSGTVSAGKIKAAMAKLIRSSKGMKIDYIAVCDPETLKERKMIKVNTLIAVAAYIGRTRLIDNILV